MVSASFKVVKTERPHKGMLAIYVKEEHSDTPYAYPILITETGRHAYRIMINRDLKARFSPHLDSFGDMTASNMVKAGKDIVWKMNHMDIPVTGLTESTPVTTPSTPSNVPTTTDEPAKSLFDFARTLKLIIEAITSARTDVGYVSIELSTYKDFAWMKAILFQINIYQRPDAELECKRLFKIMGIPYRKNGDYIDCLLLGFSRNRLSKEYETVQISQVVSLPDWFTTLGSLRGNQKLSHAIDIQPALGEVLHDADSPVSNVWFFGMVSVVGATHQASIDEWIDNHAQYFKWDPEEQSPDQQQSGESTEQGEGDQQGDSDNDGSRAEDGENGEPNDDEGSGRDGQDGKDGPSSTSRGEPGEGGESSQREGASQAPRGRASGPEPEGGASLSPEELARETGGAKMPTGMEQQRTESLENNLDYTQVHEGMVIEDVLLKRFGKVTHVGPKNGRGGPTWVWAKWVPTVGQIGDATVQETASSTSKKVYKPASAATPNPAPKCPKCGGEGWLDISGKYECKKCGHYFTPKARDPMDSAPIGNPDEKNTEGAAKVVEKFTWKKAEHVQTMTLPAIEQSLIKMNSWGTLLYISDKKLDNPSGSTKLYFHPWNDGLPRSVYKSADGKWIVAMGRCVVKAEGVDDFKLLGPKNPVTLEEVRRVETWARLSSLVGVDLPCLSCSGTLRFVEKTGWVCDQCSGSKSKYGLHRGMVLYDANTKVILVISRIR